LVGEPPHYMLGRKNDFGIALALQHLSVHFLVAGIIAALAAGGIHNDFAAGGAGLQVEGDAATPESESAMDSVQRSSQGPLDRSEERRVGKEGRSRRSP